MAQQNSFGDDLLGPSDQEFLPRRPLSREEENRERRWIRTLLENSETYPQEDRENRRRTPSYSSILDLIEEDNHNRDTRTTQPRPISRDRSLENQTRGNPINESLQTYITLEHLEASGHSRPNAAPEPPVRERPKRGPIQQSHLNNRASSPQPEHRLYILDEIERIARVNRQEREVVTTRSNKPDVKHVQTFEGRGDEFKVALKLNKLFAEIEKVFGGMQLTEDEKIICLKQKVAPRIVDRLTDKDPPTYREAKEFLLKKYAPRQPFNNAMDALASMTREADETYDEYSARAISLASLIAREHGMRLNDSVIFDVLAFSIMKQFPEGLKENKHIRDAIENYEIWDLVEYLDKRVERDSSLWKEMKAKPKVKTAERNGNHNSSESNQASYKKEKCQNCGVTGHQAQTCRRNPQGTTLEEPYRQTPSQARVNNPIRCSFCSRDYHTENNCWEKYPELAPWRRGYAQRNVDSPASNRPPNQQVSYRRNEQNNFSDRSPNLNSYRPSVRQYSRQGPRYDNRRIRNHRNNNRESQWVNQSRNPHPDRNPGDPQDIRLESLQIRRKDDPDELYSPQRNPRDFRRIDIQHVAPPRRDPPMRRSHSADFWEVRRERERDPL